MDKELENLLKDVLKEFKDLAHYLKGSNRVIKENAKNTKDEINLKKIELRTTKLNFRLQRSKGDHPMTNGILMDPYGILLDRVQGLAQMREVTPKLSGGHTRFLFKLSR